MQRFPGNCLVVALVAWLMHPLSTRVRRMRNRVGRWHWYWVRGGAAYEFRGVVPRWPYPYWRNACYLGYTELLDAPR